MKKVAAPNDDAVHRRMRRHVIVASFAIEFVLPVATPRNLFRRSSAYKVESMFPSFGVVDCEFAKGGTSL